MVKKQDLYGDIRVFTPDARKIKRLARLNNMSDADVIELFMEFVDDVCKTYRLKQHDWEV